MGHKSVVLEPRSTEPYPLREAMQFFYGAIRGHVAPQSTGVVANCIYVDRHDRPYKERGLLKNATDCSEPCALIKARYSERRRATDGGAGDCSCRHGLLINAY